MAVLTCPARLTWSTCYEFPQLTDLEGAAIAIAALKDGIDRIVSDINTVTAVGEITDREGDSTDQGTLVGDNDDTETLVDDICMNEDADASADEDGDASADEDGDASADEDADVSADEDADVSADEDADVSADEDADAAANSTAIQLVTQIVPLAGETSDAAVFKARFGCALPYNLISERLAQLVPSHLIDRADRTPIIDPIFGISIESQGRVDIACMILGTNLRLRIRAYIVPTENVQYGETGHCSHGGPSDFDLMLNQCWNIEDHKLHKMQNATQLLGRYQHDREATIAKFGKAPSPRHGAQRGEEQCSLLGRWFAELLQSSVRSTT